jgi:hypothetical protein
VHTIWDDDELILRSVPASSCSTWAANKKRNKEPRKGGAEYWAEIEGNESEIGLVMCP